MQDQVQSMEGLLSDAEVRTCTQSLAALSKCFHATHPIDKLILPLKSHHMDKTLVWAVGQTLTPQVYPESTKTVIKCKGLVQLYNCGRLRDSL